MNGSEQRNELVAAMVAALAELEDITKTKTAKIPTKAGGEYKYTFADLADVLTMSRPKLKDHGLAVSQFPYTDDKGTAVGTLVLHSSGQWMEYPSLRMPSGSDAQSHGSAITYARRYALVSILGLATEDDDGAAAKPAPQQPRAVKTERSAPSRNEGRVTRLNILFTEFGVRQREEKLRYLSKVTGRQIESSNDLSPAELDKAIQVVEDAIRSSATEVPA